MDEPLVQAEGVSRSYGSRSARIEAVRDASFEILPGQQLALFGPSGSGKSTLLHVIAGLLPATSGVIRWPALGPPDHLRPGPVSVAFQGLSLLPPLSVLENVALPILLAGGDERTALAQAEEMLDLLDLGSIAKKLPEQISGGQAQRAGVARALVGNPRLVLADEPTGQLDRATGRGVLRVMVETVSAIGSALIVATHDAQVADPMPLRWSMADGWLSTGVGARSA